MIMDITYCSRTECGDTSCIRHQFNAPHGDISIADLNNGKCFIDNNQLYTDTLRTPSTEMLHIKDLAERETTEVSLDFETLEATELATPCLICGEAVATDWFNISPKICDECKKAVMHIRNTLGL
jgi:hypothetical protein